MWVTRSSSKKRDSKGQLIAVAVDKSKGSQQALKWAIDNLLQKGQLVVLVHVRTSPPPPSSRQYDIQTKALFLPFRCFCSRKEIQCWDVMLEDRDIGKALIEYVTQSAIQVLLLGASSNKNSFLRLKKVDNPGTISKGVPEFCTVYIISKAGKILSIRSACRTAPEHSSLRNQIMDHLADISAPTSPVHNNKGFEVIFSRSTLDDTELGTPFNRGGRHQNMKSYGDIMSIDTSDVSFASSGRSSMESLLDTPLKNNRNRVQAKSDIDSNDFDQSSVLRRPTIGNIPIPTPSSNFSNSSDDNYSVNWSNMQPQAMDDVEAEMNRLKMELKQTMALYSNVCKEALSAKQKAFELEQWKAEEEKKMEDEGEESARLLVERERAKSKAAMEAAEAHKRIAEIEAQKRISAEMKALKEAECRRRAMSKNKEIVRYRKYTIEEIETATEYFARERKIGEGGYGPVFKCHLDHTLTAVKVLRPDAAQGRSQFQQEVEVLSCIRHPHMVLLLGACPEYGCLVYEYMHNGSLEDRLLCRGGTPPLPWQHRFRIAAEIATGLLFLHQTKPEPLVHRDLKPANILLDRNLVSKIGDVGLARLVPQDVAEDVTQYHMTSAAGTFCYIDPEYQQTGMLGVKSDVYSLGVMLLQVVTAKPPMGLTHIVETAIEQGNFEEMLDKNVTDWPVEEALSFTKMSLKCAEMRRKDRPDLGTVVLPELSRLRAIGEKSLDAMMFGGWYGGGGGGYYPKSYNQGHVQQEILSGPHSQESSTSTC